MRYGAVIIAVLMLTLPLAAQPHFSVHNPKNKKWDPVRADQIYDSACQVVAREVNREHPPRLEPNFTLELGAAEDTIDFHILPGGTVAAKIQLRKWDEAKFSLAVTELAAFTVVPAAHYGELAKEAISLASASISVEQLQEQK